MMLIILLSTLISASILFLSHPMSLGLMLMMQTIAISLIASSIFVNSWYSFIIFLVLIGGMMVLFIYMTSIASNEKFYMKKSMLIFMIMLTLTMFIMMKKFNISTEIMKNETMSEKFLDIKLMFNKMFNKPLNYNFIFLLIYLLITMIATIKITKFNSGPLRQMK